MHLGGSIGTYWVRNTAGPGVDLEEDLDQA